MITFIKGTERSHNGVLKVAALFAAMSSEIYQRKTLILQVADNLPDVEYMLTGHVKADEAKEYANEINTDETGIDSLLIRADTERVVKEQFDSLIDPASKDINGLDVAPRTVTENIEDTVIMKRVAMRDLMNYASGSKLTDTPYDNCILILNGKNPRLSFALEKYCDNMIVCVGQRKKDPETDIKDMDDELDEEQEKKEAAARKDHNTYIVISDYEADSIFNKRFIQKEYGEKKVFLMPHNVLFNDACATGNVVNYVAKNRETDNSDYNHNIMSEMDKLMLAIYKEQIENEEDSFANVKRRTANTKPIKELESLPEGSVTTEETTTKKFLRKPVAKTTFFIDTENPSAPSDIAYQEMSKQEGYYDDDNETDRPVNTKKGSKPIRTAPKARDAEEDDIDRPYTRKELHEIKKQQIKEEKEKQEQLHKATVEKKMQAKREKEEKAKAEKQALLDARKNARVEKERARLEAKLAKTGGAYIKADASPEEDIEDTQKDQPVRPAKKTLPRTEEKTMGGRREQNSFTPTKKPVRRPVVQEAKELPPEEPILSEEPQPEQEEQAQDASAYIDSQEYMADEEVPSEEIGEEDMGDSDEEKQQNAQPDDDFSEEEPLEEEPDPIQEEKTEKTRSIESNLAFKFKTDVSAQDTEEEVSAEDLLRSMM